MKLAELLPRHPKISHTLLDQTLTKKEVGNLIDNVYRHCGQKATVIFADRIMQLGFKEAAKAGISFGMADMVVPKAKETLVEDTRKRVAEYEKQYADGLITKGEKYNKVVDAWSKCTDKVADAMMDETSKPAKEKGRIGRTQLRLHDGALRRPRFEEPDEAARRHARPDGQAVGRDHRDADHLELQGRPLGSRVLQLDPRRP